MKRLFLVFMLALIVFPVVMAQECDTARDLVTDNLQARYKFAYYRAEQRRISMEAVIDLYAENDADTTALEEIKDDFLALYDRAKEEADQGDIMGFNDVIADGTDLIADFRQEARKQAVQGVLEAIKNTLDENEDYLDGLHADAVDAKVENYLKVFDARVCQHQVIIDRWAARDIDVSELQEDLDTIDAKRAELVSMIEAAEESCEQPYILCTTEEADDLRDLHREINDDFRNLNIKFRDFLEKGLVQAAVTLQKANIQLNRNVVNGMKNRGRDVEDAETALDDAEMHNGYAQESLDDDDIEGAKEHFNHAKGYMDQVRARIQEARA